MEKIPDEILERISGGASSTVTVVNNTCPACGTSLTANDYWTVCDIFYVCYTCKNSACGKKYTNNSSTGEWITY